MQGQSSLASAGTAQLGRVGYLPTAAPGLAHQVGADVDHRRHGNTKRRVDIKKRRRDLRRNG